MCFGRVLSLHDFWVQKCKNQLFEENKRFDFSFYQKYRRSQTRLADLKKTPNTQIFAYNWFLYDIVLKSSFSDSFENDQPHILKSLYVFYFM